MASYVSHETDHTYCLADQLRALFADAVLRSDLQSGLSSSSTLSDVGRRKRAKHKLAMARLASGKVRVVVDAAALVEADSLLRASEPDGDEDEAKGKTTLLDQVGYECASAWYTKLGDAYDDMCHHYGDTSHMALLSRIGMDCVSGGDSGRRFFRSLEANYGAFVDDAQYELHTSVGNSLVPRNAPRASSSTYYVSGREFHGGGNDQNVVLRFNRSFDWLDDDDVAAYTEADASLARRRDDAGRIFLRLVCHMLHEHRGRGSLSPCSVQTLRAPHNVKGLRGARPELSFGARVRVSGLLSEAGQALNGMSGVVTSQEPNESGRWQVSLNQQFSSAVGDAKCNVKVVKGANLIVTGMSFLGVIPGCAGRAFSELAPVMVYGLEAVVKMLGNHAPALADACYPGHAMFWSVHPNDADEVVVALHDPNVTSLQVCEATLRRESNPFGGWCASWATFEAECMLCGAESIALHAALKEDAITVIRGGGVPPGRPMSTAMEEFGTGDPHVVLTQLVRRLFLRRLDMYTRCWGVYGEHERMHTASIVAMFRARGDDERAKSFQKREAEKQPEIEKMVQVMARVQDVLRRRPATLK
jgi:hypothetical protein